MALVKCQECGNAVSDAAVVCPHCGVAAPALTKQEKGNAVKLGRMVRTAKIGGMFFLAGIGWLVLSASVGGLDSLEIAWGPAKWMIAGGAFWYIAAEVERNLSERKMRKRSQKQ